MMITDEISLSGLWPKLSTLGDTPLSAEQLSAIFVLVLLVVFAFFVIVSVNALIRSLRQTNWLLNLVKGETSLSILSKRHEIIERTEKVKTDAGHVWREFDETLIEVNYDGKSQLHNTIDSSHFFNSSTLAAGITESRMLAAVPGFLTALGVIGTFIGLQLGLSELNISRDAEVKEMMAGVSHVISGAKIAFMTSVWGVFLSVVFNFFEKGLEHIARNKIRKLQSVIDGIFTRLSAECQLQRIADDGQESRQSLQGLAEKIGEKMQESLLEVAAVIQKELARGLDEALRPAIAQFTAKTSDGNQKALESLVDNFLDKFGEQGDEQRKAMDFASQKVTDALGSLDTSMATFLNNLEESQNNSEEREKKLVSTISDKVSQLVVQSTEQGEKLTRFVESQLDGLSEKFQERDRIATDRDETRQSTFVQQTKSIMESTDELLKRIDSGMGAQLEASKALIEQGMELQKSIIENISASKESSVALMSSASELNSASQEMKVFGNHLNEASNKLSASVNDAVESTSSLARENQRARELIENNMQKIIEEREKLILASEKLASLITSVDSSFDKMRIHQNEFLADLENNVKSLAKNMTDLLQGYSEQANAQTAAHLNEWAKGTTQYAAQMNSAVQSLASLVDELEDKMIN